MSIVDTSYSGEQMKQNKKWNSLGPDGCNGDLYWAGTLREKGQYPHELPQGLHQGTDMAEWNYGGTFFSSKGDYGDY